MREQKNELCREETRIGDAAGEGASVKERRGPEAMRSPSAESAGVNVVGAQHMAVRDVAAGYHGRVVLDGLCFELPRGRILVLIGPNGAGKSTVLKTLSRALLPMQGTVTLDGRDLQRYAGEALAREVAVMLTDRAKPELMTVRDVVSLGRYPYTGRLGILGAEDRKKVCEALALVHAEELADRDFTCISDGQRQRVLLARAICQQPRVLILDEPTNGLDPAGIQEMRSLIASMPETTGATVLISSHLLGEMEQMVTQVGILNEGQLIFEGPLHRLQAHSRGGIALRVLDQKKAQIVLRAQGIASRVDLRRPDILNLSPIPDETLSDIVCTLAQNGAGVVGVTVETKNLEEIFLSLTGGKGVA